jgi:hypothetical protein
MYHLASIFLKLLICSKNNNNNIYIYIYNQLLELNFFNKDKDNIDKQKQNNCDYIILIKDRNYIFK